MSKKPWTKEVTRFEYNFYGIFSLGKEILWGMIGLLATYITDIGISAATAAIVLLVPKVWDAINDTLFGIIVDRVKLKSGEKYLPWMRIGTAIVCVCLIGLFAVPMGMSSAGKALWIVIAYILFDTGYTMLDVPMFALPSALTSTVTERGGILANGRFFAMIGGVLGGIAIPIIRPQLGWTMSAVILAIVACIAMLPLLAKAKERVNNSVIQSEGIGAKEMWNYLKRNNQLYVILLTTFICGMTGVDAILSLHVARICWGSESMAALLMIVGLVPALILGKAVPAITKKFDKVHVFVAGCIVSAVMGVLMCLTGTKSLPVYLVLSVFKCCGMVAYQIIAYMFVSDTVEFAAYRTGTNASGISFALLTFCNKLRGALVTSFALGLLSLIGFVSGEGAVQPAGVADKLWSLNTLVPAVGFAIAAVLMLTVYKLRDKDVQVMSDYNNGKISKAEADEKLAAKYGAAAEH